MPLKFVLLTTIKDLLIGFCLGVANIIPGVSGGTFLLVFGIYEKVFSILNQINKAFLIRAGKLLWAWIRAFGQGGTTSHLVSFFRETGFIFLFKLTVGTILAIVTLSGLMKFLLIHHFTTTYALFLGLILVSILIPIRMVKKFSAWTLVFILLGMGLTIFVTWTVNPYDKIKFKSDHLEQQYVTEHVPGAAPAQMKRTKIPPLTFTGRYTLDEYAYIGFCGALAISATVLPGISGSLVLILLGAYFDVITAVSALKTLNLDTFAYLGVLGLGVISGGLLFARLISFVMSRYYDLTMGFLLGLMVGSLYALWPFKQVVVMARQYVKQAGEIVVLENVSIQTNINILPGQDDPLMATFLFFILGCIIMMGFVRAESSRSL